MVARVKALGWLVACAWLVGCGPTEGQVDATNTLEGILPATEGSKDFGDYVVYFNALNTDQLKPEIAREYGIVRSKSRAMLSVSIHKKGENGTNAAVTGAVSASAVNLTGQLKTMTLREIKEAEAIYYIGEIAVTDGEVVIYTIDATPSNDPSRYTVRFKKQFFVEE
jgi:hypothetical protein